MSYIKGNFKRAIFQNHSSGYLVGLFRVKEASNELTSLLNTTVTFTGLFPDLNEIDQYILEGKMTTHAKYGEQFEVSHYERVLPTEKNSMIEILASDMFKGIGAKTAEKVVSVFHEETFDVILHRPNDLLLVPGIKEKQKQILHDALMSYQGSYETILYLTELGFQTKESMKIYHFYKEQTKAVIEEDLYQVYYDIDEVYFNQVDHIAKSHYTKDDERRLRAAIIYIMRELANSYGHTYFFKEEISTYLPRILGFDTVITLPQLEASLQHLEEIGQLVIRDEKLYLKEYYEAEIFIARRLRMMAHGEEKEVKGFDTLLEAVSKSSGIIYNEEQKLAIKTALTNQLVIITGGPGTGKTTIIKGILDMYQTIHDYHYADMQEKVALLAPTGRASKRMAETTRLGASTIHRFLKWNKETNRFQVNEYYKSDVSFVIVDEASMIDCLLLSHLLKGLSSNCHIIFVGDADQLPSVGPGNVLSDMIKSEEIKTIALKNLYRQGKDSHIITLAHQMKAGAIDFSVFQEGPDLQFITCSEASVVDHIKTVYKEHKSASIQVLAPMYKTMNGIDHINHELQALINPKAGSKKELPYGDTIYREGDKIIQLTNMPDDNVYNGDIGQITRIKTLGKKELYVDFDDTLVKYTPAMFSKFSLAYAISIHKSQGSEFDMVIVPLVKTYRKMLYRKLIYTAVTRAKKKLVIIGDPNCLELAVKNNHEQLRRTTLEKFLKEGIL